MRKLLLTLLFLPIIGFGQGQADCSLLKVADVIIDNLNGTINIAIYDGNSSGLQYPYIATVLGLLGLFNLFKT